MRDYGSVGGVGEGSEVGEDLEAVCGGARWSAKRECAIGGVEVCHCIFFEGQR